MSSNRACLCVVAWRRRPELYQTLAAIPGLDVYALSHHPENSEPRWLSELLPSERVVRAPNLGYDWGGYQQFLTTGIHQRYDYVFFSHDDIELLDQTIFLACEELIASQGGSCVVGNGRAGAKRDYPRTHIHCYAHSCWKPPSWDFCHDAVRGSFFATSRQALDRIGDFEVLWDRRGFFGVGAGNWSLRATCGKIQAALGEPAFQYLSETYRSSPYLHELERGQDERQQTQSPLVWRIRYKLLRSLASALMTGYMNSASAAGKRRLALLMDRIFSSL